MTYSLNEASVCEILVNTKTADLNTGNREDGENLSGEISVLFDRAITQCLQSADKQCNDAPLLPRGPIRLVVAFSGGLDSHLLLLLANQWCRNHAHASLRSVTVDHGLQSGSAQWVEHCHSVCQALGVASRSIKVVVEQGDGQSPEDSARKARYAAFAELLDEGEYLLTGHHADDQAETLLLQLLRGAGVRGLAAMPDCRLFANGFHLRPLLEIQHAKLLATGNSLNLQWIEDPTNKDEQYARNYVRNSVIPLLRQRWPAVVNSLSRSASHCAEAAELNRQAAEQLLGENVNAQVLEIELLQCLPVLQQKNTLRYWIGFHGYQVPSQASLVRIVEDLVMPEASAKGKVSFGRAQMARYSNRLYLADRGGLDDASAFEYVWQAPYAALLIRETGQRISLADIDIGGFASHLVQNNAELVIRSRRGGERLRLDGHAHSKSVKALLRERGYTPWERSRLPFVYLNDELIGIVGAGFTASP